MALENILNKIKENTEKKLADIELASKKECGQILSEVAKESEKILEASRERAAKESISIKERAQTLAHLQAKQDMISRKYSILNKIYENMEKRIFSLPKEEKKNIYKKWILKNSAGKQELIVSEQEKIFFDNTFLSEVHREGRKHGKDIEIKLNPRTENLAGGFILRSSHYEMDFSIENVMKSLRAETQDEVVNMLFNKIQP